MRFDFSHSIMEQKVLFGRSIWLKHDELIHPICNGNKARKFAYLLQSLPYTTWISYGGNQSNAMFALAYLAHLKGVVFKYVMPSLPSLYTNQDLLVGNLASSLQWGMQTYTLPTGSNCLSLESYAKKLIDENSLFIPQGGIIDGALEGMNSLAMELAQSIGGKPVIFYTSGSGVGVIALQKALDRFFPQADLVAIDCAGSELKAKSKVHNVEHMRILQSPFKFAKPYREIWEMRAYLASKGVACDLIYDSPAFCVLQKHLEVFRHRDIVFILSGGLMGDVTQEERYKKIFSFK